MAEEVQKTPDSQYIETQRLMMQIVAEMKEVPQLESEKEKDVKPLEKVEFPDSGGIYTYMGGHEYPYKGFPYWEFVEKIDLLKKLGRGILSGFYHRFKKRRLSLLTLIPSLWVFEDFFAMTIMNFYRIIDRFKMKPLRYCTAVRELYRAMSVKANEEMQMIRDIVCMIIEFDNAYRYRFQDVIVLLNKEALKRNPRKELIRLLEIMSSREVEQQVKDTWTLMRLVVKYYLFFNRKRLHSIVAILLELDLEQLKLSVEDEHFCRAREDYHFGFLN